MEQEEDDDEEDEEMEGEPSPGPDYDHKQSTEEKRELRKELREMIEAADGRSLCLEC